MNTKIIKYCKVKHNHSIGRRKLLSGKEAFAKTTLVELIEQFEYDGFFFNVHRGRENKNKWGVSESTTGLSVSSDSTKPKTEENYLHKTKELAISMALKNLEVAKKENPTSFYVFRARQFPDATTSLFIELKKYKIR